MEEGWLHFCSVRNKFALMGCVYVCVCIGRRWGLRRGAANGKVEIRSISLFIFSLKFYVLPFCFLNIFSLMARNIKYQSFILALMYSSRTRRLYKKYLRSWVLTLVLYVLYIEPIQVTTIVPYHTLYDSSYLLTILVRTSYVGLEEINQNLLRKTL